MMRENGEKRVNSFRCQQNVQAFFVFANELDDVTQRKMLNCSQNLGKQWKNILWN